MPDTAARDPEIAAILKRPFAEQVAFFRGKLGNIVPTAKWDDIKLSAHDAAFMVAGAAQADLLADLAMAVDKAIAGGETLDDFRQRFAEIVQRHGWHGWTGEETAQGRAWRTRIIYQTNLSTSYAAGRLAQLREAGFKLWVYKHSDAVAHPRPQHLAWNGLTLPADSPFWRMHYPPNGWGCRCRVVGASGPATARLLGGDPDKPLPEGWNALDPKTGAPTGIDKGFGYMPGGTVSDQVRNLAGKLDRLPREPSIDLIQSWLKAAAFEHWFANPQGRFPLVRLPDADAQALGAASTVRVAHLSADSAAKQAAAHPELIPAEYAQAQDVVDNATAQALETQPTGTRDMIYVREDVEGGYVLVVKATVLGDTLFVKSFYRMHRNQAVRDREIRRLLRKAQKE